MMSHLCQRATGWVGGARNAEKVSAEIIVVQRKSAEKRVRPVSSQQLACRTPTNLCSFKKQAQESTRRQHGGRQQGEAHRGCGSMSRRSRLRAVHRNGSKGLRVG